MYRNLVLSKFKDIMDGEGRIRHFGFWISDFGSKGKERIRHFGFRTGTGRLER